MDEREGDMDSDGDWMDSLWSDFMGEDSASTLFVSSAIAALTLAFTF